MGDLDAFQSLLADRDFVMVKVDLTQKSNPVHQRLLSQYAIKGVPTVVFLDGQGNECQNLRLTWIICRRNRFLTAWPR